MTIEKKFPSAALEISDIIDDQLIRCTYHGYAKREAVARFREHVRSLPHIHSRRKR